MIEVSCWLPICCTVTSGMCSSTELISGLARSVKAWAPTKFDVAAPVLMVLPVPRALVVTRPIVRSDERFSSDIVTLSGCDDPATTTTSLSEVG